MIVAKIFAGFLLWMLGAYITFEIAEKTIHKKDYDESEEIIAAYVIAWWVLLPLITFALFAVGLAKIIIFFKTNS